MLNATKDVLSFYTLQVPGKKSLRVLVLELVDVDAEAFNNVQVRLRPPGILSELRINETEEMAIYREK